MKKAITILSVLALLILIQLPAFSSGNTNTRMDFDKNDEAQVAAIMKGYETNTKGSVQSLRDIGIELIGIPAIEHYNVSTAHPVSIFYSEPKTVFQVAPNEIKKTNPSDYTFSVYSYKRIGSNIYHLQWLLQANKKETYPGPLDYASLEWDTHHASYYQSSGDGTISTIRGRKAGIVLFNIEDDKLNKGGSTFGTVQVQPTSYGTMEYGSKFTHTYIMTTATSGTASTSYGNSATLKANGEDALGLTYTYGYKVNLSSTTVKWHLWNDNAVVV